MFLGNLWTKRTSTMMTVFSRLLSFFRVAPVFDSKESLPQERMYINFVGIVKGRNIPHVRHNIINIFTNA